MTFNNLMTPVYTSNSFYRRSKKMPETSNLVLSHKMLGTLFKAKMASFERNAKAKISRFSSWWAEIADCNEVCLENASFFLNTFRTLLYGTAKWRDTASALLQPTTSFTDCSTISVATPSTTSERVNFRPRLEWNLRFPVFSNRTIILLRVYGCNASLCKFLCRRNSWTATAALPLFS